MDDFKAIVAMCLTAGVLFAALACWLSTTRGNRISDSQRSGNAINLQLMNYIKIVSGVPVVALYVVALICAVGLPLYFIYVNRLSTHLLVLEGAFDPTPQQLSVQPESLHINGNVFDISIAPSDDEQLFDVNAGQSYAPLTLQAHVDSATHSVYFFINGGKEYGPFNIVGRAAHIGTIHLTPVPKAISLK